MHKLKLLCTKYAVFCWNQVEVISIFVGGIFFFGGGGGGGSSCTPLAVQCQTLASMDALTDPVQKMLLSQPAGVNVSLDLDLSLSWAAASPSDWVGTVSLCHSVRGPQCLSERRKFRWALPHSPDWDIQPNCTDTGMTPTPTTPFPPNRTPLHSMRSSVWTCPHNFEGNRVHVPAVARRTAWSKTTWPTFFAAWKLGCTSGAYRL